MRRSSVQPEPALTYAEVGATRGPLPSGYDHLQLERVIGFGESTFRRSAERLTSWEMHRGAGIAVEADACAEPGLRVRLRLGGRLLGITAPCQVVYLIDEPRRAGFAYGTLRGHPESGEERFCVEWRRDDSVALTITAFSRPGVWWSRLVAPMSRRVQRRIIGRYLEAI